jgi:hypothetical protein
LAQAGAKGHPLLSTSSLALITRIPREEMENTITSRGYADKLMQLLTFGSIHDLAP